MAVTRSQFWLMAVPALSLIGSAMTPATAQPADLPIPPATASEYPQGVKIAKSSAYNVYANKRGLTLYGMDMRTLLRWNPDPAKYCQAECAAKWEPLLAPKDAKPNIMFPRGFGERRVAPGTPPPGLPAGFVSPQAAPDWTIIDGAAGPQWVYKGWHMVFVRKGSKRGSNDLDGAEGGTWNTLKFVPPVPVLTAPSNVAALFTSGAYALTDKDGRVLFTGQCDAICDGWVPFTGGMASRAIGDWQINTAPDAPQWHYRGKAVFVSQRDDPTSVPAGGTVLRP